MKKLKLIMPALVLLCLILAACSSIPADYKPQADENPFLVDVGYKKPEITLDGLLDESVWDGLQTFTFGDEIVANVKAFYGESGLCIGAEVSDPEMWAISSMVYDNTSFELYLDYSGKGGVQPENEQVQIFIDVNEKCMTRRGNGGKWHEDNMIKNYAVKVNGTVGAKDPTNGYCVELFIPYSQMGGKPQVDYGVAFGLVGCRDNVRQLWRGAPGVDVQSPQTYLKLYRDTNSIEYYRKVNTSNLELDGLANDAAWAGKLYYYFGDGGRGAVMTHMDEKGVYFFMKMKDDAVCSQGNSVFLNDSVEVYIDALSNGGKKPQTDDVQVDTHIIRGKFAAGNGCHRGIFCSLQKFP